MSVAGDIWYCRIGATPDGLPGGSDLPMREAIAEQYRILTGADPDYIFSGWGQSLSESEIAVVEGRNPDHGLVVGEKLEDLLSVVQRQDDAVRALTALMEKCAELPDFDPLAFQGALMAAITQGASGA